MPASLVLDVARQLHPLVGIDRRRLAEPVEIIRRDPVVTVVSLTDCGIDLGRVDVHREHAVRKTNPARARCARAGERTGQQLTHHRDARALVLPHSPQGTGTVHRIGPLAFCERVQHPWVAGDLAVAGDQRVIRHGRTAVQRDHRLALGHHRRGKVMNDRSATGDRCAVRTRIGAHPPRLGTERSYQPAVRDVHEVHRDEPLCGSHLGVLADPTEVPGIAQPHDRYAQLLTALDAHRHRRRTDGLAHAVLTVYEHQRTRVDQHLEFLVGELNAVGQQIDIQR